jgi:S1-C subfamily serine protease
MPPIRTRLFPAMLGLLLALTLSACSLGSSSSTMVAPSPTTAPSSSSATSATTVPTASAATTAPTTASTTAPVATTASNATTASATTTGGTTTANASASTTPATSLISAPIGAGGQPLSVAQINQKVRPAVVQVTNNQKAQGRFGAANGAVVPAGVGTGFIFDKRGYILTNNHVVEGATTLTVATTDNKTYDAKIVGTYPQGDLAVIQINGNGDLPTVALGDSNKLQVGDPVVAIGNALALQGGPTVTSGVVSALGRVEQEPGNGPNSAGGVFLVDLIQTDAAINPGNSGGPLLNAAGEVVGINTLGSTQAQGIGFAISINSAKPVADALIAGQPVPRPFVGISTGSLNPQQDAQLKLPANTGVGVASVVSGSPADKAGVQINDIIIKFDGQTVKGEEGFVGFLLAHKPGDTVTFTVLRNGQQQDLKITLGQAPTQ